MSALVLLVGFWCAAVTLAVGYNALPAFFVLASAGTVAVLRWHDRRHGDG